MDLFGNSPTVTQVIRKVIKRAEVVKEVKTKPVKEKKVKEVKEVKLTKSYAELHLELVTSKMYLGSMYYLEANHEGEGYHFFKTYESDIDSLVTDFKSRGIKFIYKRFLPTYITELRKQIEETKLMWSKHKTKKL